MSLKKVNEVKKDKGFKLFDLIIYGVIAVLVAVLFIVVFTTRNTDPLTGVKIYVKAQPVFEYEFGGEINNLSPETITVEEKEGSITLTVQNGDDLNVIYIDKSAKSVKMIEANCRGGECMYLGTMNNNSKFIFCSPHGLKIEPYYKDYDNPNIIF